MLTLKEKGEKHWQSKGGLTSIAASRAHGTLQQQWFPRLTGRAAICGTECHGRRSQLTGRLGIMAQPEATQPVRSIVTRDSDSAPAGA
eukprot:672131-Rhodomonas_salina.1